MSKFKKSGKFHELPRKSIIFFLPTTPHPYPTGGEGLGVNIGGREGRDGWEGGTDRREGCDGNYEVGAYGMEWVHDREQERSRVTS